MNFDLAKGSLICSNHIFFDFELSLFCKLIYLDYRIGKIGANISFELVVKHHIDTILVLRILL